MTHLGPEYLLGVAGKSSSLSGKLSCDPRTVLGVGVKQCDMEHDLLGVDAKWFNMSPDLLGVVRKWSNMPQNVLGVAQM